MREPPRLLPLPAKPTPSLLRYMSRTAAEDARADARAGDYHLYQMMGKIHDSGRMHGDAWICYMQAYEAELERLRWGGPRSG